MILKLFFMRLKKKLLQLKNSLLSKCGEKRILLGLLYCEEEFRKQAMERKEAASFWVRQWGQVKEGSAE